MRGSRGLRAEGRLARIATKRDKLSIILDILKACSAGASKTNIAYQANLNSRTVTICLNLLIDIGLIEVTDESVTTYKTTDDGSNLMRDLKGILNVLGSAEGFLSSR